MKIGNVDVQPKITTMVALSYASSQGVPAVELFNWMPRQMTPIQYIGLFVAACGGKVTTEQVHAEIDINTDLYGAIVEAVVNEIIDPNKGAETTK